MSKRLLRALGQRPNVPLESTTLTNGLFNLPLELWLDIFAYAATFSVPNHSLAMELQDTGSTYQALSHDHSVLSDIPNSHHPALFSTRHSIILVCKAWYKLGIHTLYSHVLINAKDRLEKVESLYRSLRSHPPLAASVTRLTITTKEAWYFRIPIPRSNRRILAKLIPVLINLRIFTFPFSAFRDLHPISRPEVLVLLQEEKSYRDYSFFDRRASLQLASQVHTLYLKSHRVHPTGFFDSPATILSAPSLPNLVNLRLELQYNFEGECLANNWILPRLRTLSISCNRIDQWLKLIQRHAERLEALEITPLPIRRYHYYTGSRSKTEDWDDTVDVSAEKAETIRLPNLIKLCIPASDLQRSRPTTDIYLKLFIAPRLIQLCYRLPCIS